MGGLWRAATGRGYGARLCRAMRGGMGASGSSRRVREQPDDGRRGLSRVAVIDDPHRVPELRAVHDARLQWRLTRQGPAELAPDRAAVVDVHALPDQRGAVTTSAAFAPGRELIDPPAQQCELEGWHVTNRAVHEPEFGAAAAVPPDGPAHEMDSRRVKESPVPLVNRVTIIATENGASRDCNIFT
jgi:hypothetical protein